jgi:uncharacterized protein (TIGR00266 family)
MAFMDGTVEMKTSAKGGVFKGLKRMFSGESFFVNTFTGPGKITFAPGIPGDIVPLSVSPSTGGWILSKDAFLAGTPDLDISSKSGGFKSLFGGEGLFLTHVSAKEVEGLFFAAGYGAIQKHEIPDGQSFVVDTGLFLATSERTEFKTSKVGGMKSFLFGGEGLVMRFFGPAIVLTQSRSLQDLAALIAQFITPS